MTEQMTVDIFQHLECGDIVRSAGGTISYVVTGNYGTHVTAVRTVDITNPSEWLLIKKANPTPNKRDNED